MHNLAIALKNKGYVVTGSDDEIFEPSRSRLANLGLLPEKFGWYPEKITKEIDTVILGMHAREDNPELLRAKELKIDIKSFPEYLYEQTKDKKRIIVAGSHGKTTVTAMIMHVFRTLGVKFDYMVGSQIDGFDTMVGLSNDSNLAVFEGDEYLTSPIDKRPKFHLYMPDIAIINGIAWDHMNVFPTFDNYVDQFRIFIDKISEGGRLLYCGDDPEVVKLANKTARKIDILPYYKHPYIQDHNGISLVCGNRTVPIELFGEHNMQNISSAKGAVTSVGISENDFYGAISTFTGTAKRLQKILETEKGTAYIDFAHSPSKVKATVDAVASRYPGREIIACFELHTFSSLSSNFLPHYAGTLENATCPYIYFSNHALELKKLPKISKDEVMQAFANKKARVYNNSNELFADLKGEGYKKPVFLFMSSGNFDGQDIVQRAKELLS